MLEVSNTKYSKAVAGVLLALGKFNAATKQLKIQTRKAGTDLRKLVISTNWLDTIGLHEGRLIKEQVIGNGQGMIITPAQFGDTAVKKVYGRSYKNRNTERETMLQIASQKVLDEAIGDAERVHITFLKEQVVIKPIHAAECTSTEGVTFHIEQDQYSGVVEALEVIKQKRFAEIQYSADSGAEEDIVMLFSIQLRRMGYVITQEGGIYRANKAEATNFKPLEVQTQKDRIRFDFKNPTSVFAACTSGVDVYAMEQEGFKTNTILEYRPQEARDTTDKTELGAINAACASEHVSVVINEDIYEFDAANLSTELRSELNGNIFHISVQCDDFSSLKTHAQRQQAIENLSTTQDMVFPALSIIKEVNPSIVVLENVANFEGSAAHKVFTSRLSSLGYTIYSEILNAKDFNGLTGRARCFVVATKLPVPFSMPQKEERRVFAGALVDYALQNNLVRDVTHTVSVQKGIETGRIRTLTRDKSVAPTLTKSQARQTKDSCYIEVDNHYYLPSEEIQKLLMGIAPEFDFVAGNAEERTEMIGQSVDIPTHSKLMRQVKNHIKLFLELVKERVAAKANQPTVKVEQATPVNVPAPKPAPALSNRFAVMF